MITRVLLFAAARDACGDWIEVDAPEGVTARELVALLAEQFPALEPLLPHCRLAIGEAYAADHATVPPHSEIALIPPVSGG
ncbi:MAG: MoaD/ThiS family protein [Planctomycetota bacterium]